MKDSTVGFKDSQRLTQWVKICLYAQIIVAIISLLTTGLEYKFLYDVQNGVYTSQEMAVSDGEASDFRQNIVLFLYLIVILTSAFLILRWIHRANYNARQLGAENMNFTPGWSIGFYFIPILTLWKPYQAMREIWQTSKTSENWMIEEPSWLLPIWWTLWLISNFLGRVIYKMSTSAEEVHQMMDVNLLNQLSNVLDILLAMSLFLIVDTIHKMQSNRHESNNSVIDEPQVSLIQDRELI